MSRAVRYWRWILVSALGLGIPAAYCAGRWQDVYYLDGFMGNWLATVLGLVVGVPVALAISDWEQRERARQEEEHQQREQSARRVKVLQLIAQELKHNLDALLARGLADNPGRLMYADARPSDEMWKALSDGGELHCIGDLPLLGAIARAYHQSRAGEYFLLRIWEVLRTSAWEQVFADASAEKLITSALRYADLETTQCIKQALGAVDAALQAEGSERSSLPGAGW